jgi:hypothetical protein
MGCSCPPPKDLTHPRGRPLRLGDAAAGMNVVLYGLGEEPRTGSPVLLATAHHRYVHANEELSLSLSECDAPGLK